MIKVLPAIDEKPPNRQKQRAVSNTASEFAEVSTTHGIFYIFERKYGKLSQLLWFFICISLVIVAVSFIEEAYTEWKVMPVITSVKTTGLPVRDLEYPAITICGLGKVTSVIENVIAKRAIDYITAKIAPKPIKMVENPTSENLFTANNVNYTEFFNNLVPGLSTNFELVDMVSLMAASKPDAYLFSTLAAQGDKIKIELLDPLALIYSFQVVMTFAKMLKKLTWQLTLRVRQEKCLIQRESSVSIGKSRRQMQRQSLMVTVTATLKMEKKKLELRMKRACRHY